MEEEGWDLSAIEPDGNFHSLREEVDSQRRKVRSLRMTWQRRGSPSFSRKQRLAGAGRRQGPVTLDEILDWADQGIAHISSEDRWAWRDANQIGLSHDSQ